MKLTHTLAVVGLAASLSACIVAPHRPYVQEAAPAAYTTAPAPVAVNPVHVAPSYPQPAYGYFWAYNPFWGWGWRHQHHGWHHRGHRR
jgi:hypothetical protein